MYSWNRQSYDMHWTKSNPYHILLEDVVMVYDCYKFQIIAASVGMELIWLCGLRKIIDDMETSIDGVATAIK